MQSWKLLKNRQAENAKERFTIVSDDAFDAKSLNSTIGVAMIKTDFFNTSIDNISHDWKSFSRIIETYCILSLAYKRQRWSSQKFWAIGLR